jgi:16S rRNA (guanine527-N7)-methyltransferase
MLDSLAAVGPVRERMGDVRSLVDIGSGGGYPGIPLGLVLGAASLGLVESVGRKARFLEVAGAAAGAAVVQERRLDVEVLDTRAEELAVGKRRASWDVATLRAVGSVAECAELGLPLLRPGGLLVCWKRDAPVDEDGGIGRQPAPSRGVAAEVDAALALVARLGGGTPEVLDARVPGAPGHRLVLVRKERPTPAGYPRPPAVRRGRRAGRP